MNPHKRYLPRLDGSRHMLSDGLIMDVADSNYNIANLFETQGKRDEARKLFLECEKIYSKVYGPDHTETLDAARRAEEEEDKVESEEEDEE